MDKNTFESKVRKGDLPDAHDYPVAESAAKREEGIAELNNELTQADRMKAKELQDCVDVLKVARDEIMIHLQEMQQAIEQASSITGNSMITRRALAYWLTHVRETIDVNGKGSMVNLDDTLSEICKEIEDVLGFEEAI